MWDKPGMQAALLVPHAQTPSDVVERVDVRVRRDRDGRLALTFGLEGRLSALRLPPTTEPRRGHELWRHTCFEAFVARDGTTEYHELNLAPSREWAVYAFRAYRDGEALDDQALAPRIVVRRQADRLELDALVVLDRLSPRHRDEALRVALAAVVEEHDGTLSYWALRHPSGRPDFHHADGFALRLEPPDVAC
jgi:hypothetical protein